MHRISVAQLGISSALGEALSEVPASSPAPSREAADVLEEVPSPKISESKFPLKHVMLKKQGLIEIAEFYNSRYFSNIEICLIPGSAGKTDLLRHPEIASKIIKAQEQAKAQEQTEHASEKKQEFRKCIVVGNEDPYSHKISILYVKALKPSSADDGCDSNDESSDNEFLIIMDSQGSKYDDVRHFNAYGSTRYIPGIIQADSHSCAPFCMEFGLLATQKKEGEFSIPCLSEFFSNREHFGARGDLSKLPPQLHLVSQISKITRCMFSSDAAENPFFCPGAKTISGEVCNDHAYLRVKSQEYKKILLR